MATDPSVSRSGDPQSVYCASERAIVSGTAAYGEAAGDLADSKGLAAAFIAAHHPQLGSDRSVCLRDVIEALENGYHVQNPSLMHPADFVTLKFEGDGYEGLRDIRRTDG